VVQDIGPELKPSTAKKKKEGKKRKMAKLSDIKLRIVWEGKIYYNEQ
jgi:hypothetical protein